MLQKNLLDISVIKKITACILLCFIANSSTAQVRLTADSLSSQFKQQQQLLQQNDYSITGRVTDENGKPLKTATVLTLNNSFLSFTDDEGYFSIKLKYPDIKEYTNLSFGYTGKQLEIRNVHIAAFPAVVNVKMEPIKECTVIDIVKSCCAIDVSWTIDKVFEKESPPGIKKKYKNTSRQ